MINYLALLSAIFISGVAAYYSIMGLIAIFSAAVIPIMLMGIALESSKLIAASWVYRNWDTCPKIIKYYLVMAVIALMFITSMGIFGFLSKAHMDQNLGTTSNIIVIKNLERDIQSEESNIKNNQRLLDSFDRLVTESDAKVAVTLLSRQKKDRESANTSIKNSASKIKELNSELEPIRKENAAFEAEVGPIKYVADLLYGEESDKYIDNAIRWVIIIIVMVFDPLAVILLIAANIGLKGDSKKVEKRPKKEQPDISWLSETKDFLKKRKNDIIQINRKSIHKIE